MLCGDRDAFRGLLVCILVRGFRLKRCFVRTKGGGRQHHQCERCTHRYTRNQARPFQTIETQSDLPPLPGCRNTRLAPCPALSFDARIESTAVFFPTIRERLGGLSALWQKTASEAIWLHAVSVGEVLAAVPLVEELRRRSPPTPIFISTSTLGGREMAAQRLASLVSGIFYAPVDYVWVVRRVLRRLLGPP